MIRLLLADDHAIVREGLAQLLAERPGVEVVGQAGSGEELMALATAARADVLLLDYSMPGVDTPGTIEHLRRLCPRLRILVLTVHESIHYAIRALESGAHGYVIKSAAVRELMEALETVCRDEVYISPAVSQKVLRHLRSPRRDRCGVDSLSPREFELLSALGAGMSLGECARHLNVTVSTASTYRTRLMEKLALRSTAEIIRFALENDIVG